jgi:hypothetical protein
MGLNILVSILLQIPTILLLLKDLRIYDLRSNEFA